jgi:hypothetical protein
MRAIMSDRLRNILRDPKANKELEKGISKLSAQGEKAADSVTISVGNQKYEVQFVESESETKK